MKDLYGGHPRRLVPARDRFSHLVMTRIPPRAEGETHAGFGLDVQGRMPVELTATRRHQQRRQIGLEPRQDDLRLRIAESRVELEHLRPGIGDHETRVEHPPKGYPF